MGDEQIIRRCYKLDNKLLASARAGRLRYDKATLGGYYGRAGRTIWAIGEGYIPSGSNGPEPHFLSHELACLLNASADHAHVRNHDLFSDRRAVWA